MRYELILNGTIKDYYDDFVDTVGYYQCVGCKQTSEKLYEIKHSENCPVFLTGEAKKKSDAKIDEIRETAKKKLTQEEIDALGL